MRANVLAFCFVGLSCPWASLAVRSGDISLHAAGASRQRHRLEVPNPTELFKQFDRDGTGGLHSAELTELLKSLKFSDEEAQQMFTEIDGNSDAIISGNEFISYINVPPDAAGAAAGSGMESQLLGGRAGSKETLLQPEPPYAPHSRWADGLPSTAAAELLPTGDREELPPEDLPVNTPTAPFPAERAAERSVYAAPATPNQAAYPNQAAWPQPTMQYAPAAPQSQEPYAPTAPFPSQSLPSPAQYLPEAGVPGTYYIPAQSSHPRTQSYVVPGTGPAAVVDQRHQYAPMVPRPHAAGWRQPPGAAGAAAAPGPLQISPFGGEDTAQELQTHAAKTQDTLIDAVENAQVAEVKRAVFRALTRLRAAQIKEFDTIARLETQAIDEYNDNHHYRKENPIQYLDSAEGSTKADKYASFH